MNKEQLNTLIQEGTRLNKMFNREDVRFKEVERCLNVFLIHWIIGSNFIPMTLGEDGQYNYIGDIRP
jgi:hypothetical protein